LLTHRTPNTGAEKYGYSANIAGPSSYAIPAFQSRQYTYDPYGRKLKEVAVSAANRLFQGKAVRRFVWSELSPHNLKHCLRVKASREYQLDIQRISFKGTVDSVRQFSVAIAQARSGKKQKELIDKLLQTIALDLVPERPGRREPRAAKRRPKPCARLTKPRHKFKESQHRNRNWKNKPKKTKA
jgi:hypothetical protein